MDNKHTNLQIPLIQTSNRLPRVRSIFGIGILADYARDQGFEVEMILDGSGISLADLNNYDTLVTLDQELKAIKNFITLIPDPAVGLKVGKLNSISANLKVSIPAIFSNTFLDCIRFTGQYIELTLLMSQFRLYITSDTAILTLKLLADFGEISRFIWERELVGIQYSFRAALGFKLPLKELRLTYPRPDYVSNYQYYFHCSIIFNADECRFSFDLSYLHMRLPMANAIAKEAFEKECEKEYARLKEFGTDMARIKQELLYYKEGFPNIDQFARLLNISSRTLRRRLISEGTTYKQLVSETRMTKAFNLLRNTNEAIERISTDLGYSDVSNFYTAFRKWTGTTPSKYRRDNLP